MRRWGGAAPVPAAILAGDARTGATIMRVVRALDAGPMLDRVEVAILPDDTAGTLLERVAESGAALLVDVLPKWAAGQIQPQPQDESLATYAPQITKTDALIDWEADSAELVCRKVRAFNPWPVAYSHLDGRPLRILECMAIQRSAAAEPGTIRALADGPAAFAVATAAGEVAIVRVQASGRNAMSAADYLRGHPQIIGKRLSKTPL